MKKLYTLLLVVALTVMAVLPVMATTKKSPTATDVTPPPTPTVFARDITITQITDATIKSMINDFVGSTSNLTALGVDTKAKMLTYMDINYTGAIPESGIPVPMKITGAKAGDYVYVLHAVKSISNVSAWAWEVVGKGYLSANLTITATFKSFSPVVIMKVDASNANATTINAESTVTSTTTNAESTVTPTTTPPTVLAKDVTMTQIIDATIKSIINDFVGTASNLATLGVDAMAKVLTYMDINYTGTIPEGGIQLPMKITGAKAGDYVYVLHARKSTANASAWTWEVVGKGYLSADLTITATFKSFSPVVIMKVDAADANATTTNGNTAPKTGEF